MKNYTCIVFLIILFNIFSIQAAIGATGRLTIHVDGFENNTGHLRISLINKAEEFKEGGLSFLKKEVWISDKQATVTFFDVPYGYYAIQLYHDENDNNRLDRFPLLGFPTERYGFSNNRRNSSGRANFDEAKFSFHANDMVLNITVKSYW